MRTSLAACGALVAGLLLAQVPGAAHHPLATEFDTDRDLTLTGTVESFEWTSPHSELELMVKDGDRSTTWSIELDGESALDELGWSRDTLKEGRQVTVQAWPARDGSARAVAWAVRLEDGRELAAINPHDPAWAAYAQQQDAPTRPGAERAGREVALVGCVALDSDTPRADVASDDRFVLVDARPAPEHLAQEAPVGTTGDAPRDGERAREGDRAEAPREGQPGATAGAVGTSGDAGAEVYTLTGDQADELAGAVGRQVHVIGLVEDGDRISVTAWHPVNDFCPPNPLDGVQPQDAAQPQSPAPQQDAR
jgi:hypothetical protein